MIRDIIMASVFGLFIGVAINVPWDDWVWPTVPYEQVTILNEGEVEEGYRLKATFLKNECVFQYMEFYGHLFGDWDRVDYVDTEEEIGDRPAGWHTFDVVALTGGVKYDKIELRTRHRCTEIIDGKEVIEIVDRVFYHTATISPWRPANFEYPEALVADPTDAQ